MRGHINVSKLVGAVVAVVAVGLAVGLVTVSSTASFASAVVALAALVVSVAAFYSIETGLMALLLVASTDGFLKGLSPGWHTQVLKDYLLVLCVLRWAWLSVLGNRRESVRQPIVIPLIMFVLWVGMQMFNTTTHNFLLALAGMRAWVIWPVVFFITFDTIRKRVQLERHLIFVTALLVPIALYTIVQYNIGYDHLYRLGPGFRSYTRAGYFAEDMHIEIRPSATMISPHNNAAALSCGLLAAAGGILFLRRRRSLQLLTMAALPLQGVALLLTAARAAFASTAFAAFALLVLIRRPGIAVVLGLITLVAVTQVGRLTEGHAVSRAASVITRAHDSFNRAYMPMRMAVNYARDHPFGSGVATGHAAGRIIWGQLKSSNDQAEEIPWAENEWGRALIELGVPGLILYAWLVFSVLRAMYRVHRECKTVEYSWLAAGLLSACLGVTARLSVGAALYTWPEGILFWMFAALCLRLPEMEAEEPEVIAAAEANVDTEQIDPRLAIRRAARP